MSKQTAVDYLVEQLESIGFSTNDLSEFYNEIEIAKQMEKEQIKNAQMDMFHHFNDLPYGFTYFKELHKAEDFADNYKTFGGNNE